MNIVVLSDRNIDYKDTKKNRKKSIFMNLFYDYFNSDSYKKLILKYKFASAFKMQNNGNELNTVNLIIPRSVSCFAPNIFHNGPCIEEITFQKPSHIENLCNRVFYGRTSLKKIEIPASTSERPVSALD